jgi:hypothetical protein
LLHEFYGKGLMNEFLCEQMQQQGISKNQNNEIYILLTLKQIINIILDCIDDLLLRQFQILELMQLFQLYILKKVNITFTYIEMTDKFVMLKQMLDII